MKFPKYNICAIVRRVFLTGAPNDSVVLENGYVQTFPSTFPTSKTTFLYRNTLSPVGFSVIPKCVTLNDL